MSENRSYTGIDYFRFIAAFFIIAIHTSPLLSYSEMGDFILTRIVARAAVPFFLMTSGFFLISRYTYDSGRLKLFLKRTAVLYGISMAVYIPVNIYNGYFYMDNLLPNIIKDIFFDGTMYHLWYLPASMIGAVIAWFLVKNCGFGKAFAITSILYVIGMFGDSYYGIAETLPVLKSFYHCLFQISDYTRNGIFFAPVFFVAGGIIADRSVRLSLRSSLTGFFLSFGAMAGEAMILHRFDLQRHDSMYVMLLPAMYFLFTALTHWKGRRVPFLRTSAMIIYMIHPMMIVAVRLAAKLFGMRSVMVENSFVHYLIVSVLSAAFSVLAALLLQKKKKCKGAGQKETQRAWMEVNLDNLQHNAAVLEEAMPRGCSLMAVVKAEAYGHGSFVISTCLDRMGVRAYAVASIEEGIRLRKYGIRGEILILGYTAPERAKELCKYDLSQTAVSFEHADRLNRQGVPVRVHIKIDTGMHRLGFDPDDLASVLKIFRAKNLRVEGIYTHLGVSDSHLSEDAAFTKGQIEKFYGVLSGLARKGIKLPKIHIQSSYGFWNYPELQCNYVRAGVALYGVLSSSDDEISRPLDLRPVLSLKSRVVLIRKVKQGDCVGYGRAFTAGRDSVIAILSIGYADGLPRSLSCGRGEVLIRGRRAPVAGRICMDQLAVDVTDIPDVSVGDAATLIGRDGKEELAAPAVADRSGSITNELLSRMGTRLGSVVV